MSTVHPDTIHPDIVVVTPEGEYLIVVEVKTSENLPHCQSAIEQLKWLMASVGCSVGLAVVGDHMFLLRDSLEKSGGESIAMVGEARLPENFLPSPDEQWKGNRGLEFESQVQRWLEQLKQTSNLTPLPSDLKELLGESITSLLRLGEVRAASPRWSRVAS